MGTKAFSVLLFFTFSFRFIVKDRETFFSSAQRSQIVWAILMRTPYNDEDVDKVKNVSLNLLSFLGFARLQAASKSCNCYCLVLITKSTSGLIMQTSVSHPSVIWQLSDSCQAVVMESSGSNDAFRFVIHYYSL